MIWTIFYSALLILLGYILIDQLYNKSERLPPGLKHLPIVKGIPIFGIFFQIKPPLYSYLMNFTEKYGHIFRINFGMRKIVVLNDFEMIKRTLKGDGDSFSGRWNTKLDKMISDDTGILFIDGEKWIKQRMFLFKVLRDFGFGKPISHEIVQGECKLLIDELDNLQGQDVDFSDLIPIYTGNIISKFIMRKRFSRDDQEMKAIDNAIFELTKKQNFVRLFHLMFPIFDDSEIISRFSLWVMSQQKLFDLLKKIFKEEINEHLATLDFNTEGEDLMDRFLIEQHRLVERNGDSESFTNTQLIFMTFEIFAAGYETTSTTLGWGLLLMAKYPNIQKMVHDEIIEKIGSERLPTMNDNKLLIYTKAVLDEIHRIGSVVPLSLLHKTINDTSVKGYFIPKNSIIFPNLYACHRDPRIWQKPLDFYPDHFLERSKDDILKYVPREELIPFGIGKRQCIGESLGKMEYFIFFVAILQRFQVRSSHEISEEGYEDALRGNEGILRYSKIKNFIFERY